MRTLEQNFINLKKDVLLTSLSVTKQIFITSKWFIPDNVHIWINSKGQPYYYIDGLKVVCSLRVYTGMELNKNKAI
jgi:hypothetical protein